MPHVAARLSRCATSGSFTFTHFPFPAGQLLTALENSPIGVAICDRRLRYAVVNRSLAEMHNLPPDEHLGRTIHEVIGSLAPNVETRLEHVFSTGRPLYNTELCGQLGKRIDVGRWLENYFPIVDECGRVMQVGVFVVEVSRLQLPMDQKRSLSSTTILTGRHPSLSAKGVEQIRSSMVHHASNMDQRPIPSLTPRETDVLRLLASGQSNKETSSTLVISVKTVETYRARLMLKLHATSVAQLVHFAIRHHVVALQG
jgi:DNA-binding CsgD family transcriptional regulator